MGRTLIRKEVSDKFQLKIATLDYLVQTGQIPFSRIGKRCVRFDEDRLDAWFRSREGIEFRHQRHSQG